MCCLLNAVYTVTFWIFIGLMAISALMIILGAFTFVTSGGSPDKTTQARNYIIFAAIGIAVALFSRAVPSLVKLVVGSL
jgi:cellulose synthase/poly-beta-1,6-N-acetylglucosamine synthase-like glycosyltransferase